MEIKQNPLYREIIKGLHWNNDILIVANLTLYV